MSDNLAAALAKVQGQLTAVGKDKTAQVRSEKGSYSYGYADLAAVQAAVLPLLAEHGLAFTAAPTLIDGQFVLDYSLMHGASGEEKGGHYPLPDPTRGTPQQIGSAITYARRYCLSAVTGVATEDDDGAAASDGRAPKAQARREPPKRAERGPVPAEADPFVAPEWAVSFRTLLAKAMTPEAVADREVELTAAVKAEKVSAEWGRTLWGEVQARKAHLAEPPEAQS